MSTWDTQSEYFSGQGVVLIGLRNAAGEPMALYPVGNVSDVKIAVSTSTLEHKESQSGQRATDLRLTTETKCAMSMVMEDFNSKNLVMATRGASTEISAGDETDVDVLGYPGAVSPLPHLKVSEVVVKADSVALTAYVDDDTAWDYKLNADAGSIMLNDGSAQDLAKLGVVPSAVAVGATTTITAPNNLSEGDMVSLRGFTGADAATLNDKTFSVVSATASAFVLSVDTSTKTITVGAGSYAVWPGIPLEVSYDYAAQTQIDALVTGVTDVFMRFEGLNTADEMEPVVVEVFRFSTDPLKELSLISDQVQQFALEGSVLSDATKTTGSKFFRVRRVA